VRMIVTNSRMPRIAIRAMVTKTGDAIVVDLTESDPQVPSFLNSSWPNTVSAVRMAIVFLLDPEVAKNVGCFPPWRLSPRKARLSCRTRVHR
jgi:N-methylhydantoinase B/oxoprolinase/acetone carboxylase alpha subunit